MREIDNDEIEIDLGELFAVLMKRWWLILLTTVLCGALALLGTLTLMKPKYESSAMLYILSKTTSVTSLADIQIGSELTADFEVIAKSKPVLDSAVQKLKEEDDAEFTRDELDQMISVSNISDTRILVITATSEDPTAASLVANAVAEATSEQMAYIMKSDQPTTVEQAEVSKNPVSPNLKKNLMVGLLAGIVLSCAVIVLRFLMNNTISNETDVERYLEMPTLAVVPLEKKKKRR